ncbi:DUF6538 domain-containing protein [Paracoccus bogoriensis]|uniref:DUF6538 domain-containing protein n=1 Tax=Paracoccus bogoriensis TaxID=242065 RepID=UPI001FEAB43E|nr:DUF6538 domain-containing protein [Paracoccus bogoriensis]
MRIPTVILRENTWHIRKRVPVRYAAIEPRPIIHISLHTDSRAIAQAKAVQVWSELIEAWEAKPDGAEQEAEARMAAARNLAQRRGYRYSPRPRSPDCRSTTCWRGSKARWTGLDGSTRAKPTRRWGWPRPLL